MLVRFCWGILLLALAGCGAARNDEFAEAWKWTCYDEAYHMGKESLTDETYGAGRASISAAQMRLMSARSSR